MCGCRLGCVYMFRRLDKMTRVVWLSAGVRIQYTRLGGWTKQKGGAVSRIASIHHAACMLQLRATYKSYLHAPALSRIASNHHAACMRQLSHALLQSTTLLACYRRLTHRLKSSRCLHAKAVSHIASNHHAACMLQLRAAYKSCLHATAKRVTHF